MKTVTGFLFLLCLTVEAGIAAAADGTTWTNREGVRVEGDLLEYDWKERVLLLEVDDSDKPERVFVSQLDWKSRGRLAFSAPYHESLAQAIREGDVRLGADDLTHAERRRLTWIFWINVSMVVCACFLFDWILASDILKEGSLMRWGGAVLLWVFFLAVFLLVWRIILVKEIWRPSLWAGWLIPPALAALAIFLSVFSVYGFKFWRSLWFAATASVVSLLLTLVLSAVLLTGVAMTFEREFSFGAVGKFVTDQLLRPLALA